ncbi:Apoptosis inhibitor 5 [Mortierella alpina]|nr:Apoptosis inhibitor 5 [Mortierella alpina]
MADLDQIYNAYNEITDAKGKASEHAEAYKIIIAGSQGSDGVKRLTAQFIPTFFKHFPALHTKAIDGVFDLCEDDSSLIRQAAIKSLPMLCKDGPQHTIKIADVLCQLLQLEVLAVIFQQGIKGTDLRERCLDFISHHVMASKNELFKDPEIEVYFAGEIQKAMSSVSNGDLETLAKIIMQTRPYQTGVLDLTGLFKAYMAHITSEGPFNAIVPTEQEATQSMELAQVECLTNLLYFIAAKEPGVTDKDELLPRFRGLYMTTQTNISKLKQEMAGAVAKKPQDDHQIAVVKKLGKTLLMQNNIHATVKEFMKPKHLRNTKTTIHPSWKAVPEPAQTITPKVAAVSKTVAKGTPKKAVSASNSNTTNATGATTKVPVKASHTKASVKSTPNQQQQQQQLQGGSNKRKAESESSSKTKKTKILRRQGTNAGGNSPGNTSPGGHGHGNKSPGGHGNKGSKQNQAHQQTQHAPLVSQSAQAAQQAKKTMGGSQRGHHNLPSSFDNKRARDGNGRISFLKR